MHDETPEALRPASLAPARRAWTEARMAGLCAEGAWEAAIGALLTDVEERARGDILDHPGQMYPADHYADCTSAAARAALAETAVRLVRTAEHPEVFRIALHLGAGRAWVEALLERLERGPAVPDAVGTGGPTLLDDATDAFAWAAPDLLERVAARLRGESVEVRERFLRRAASVASVDEDRLERLAVILGVVTIKI